MEAILEILAILNGAIESGTMTQAAMATAILAIAQRLHVEWEAGNLSPSLLLRADEEMRFLSRRWKAHQEAAKLRSKPPESDIQPKLVPNNDWRISECRVEDPFSGLCFEFTHNGMGEPRLRVTGPGVSRTIDFGGDGCVHISNGAQGSSPLPIEEGEK